MTTSLNIIDQLKQLTLKLSDSPVTDYRKVTTMFEAMGGVVEILTKQNEKQQKLLDETVRLKQECLVSEARYQIIFDTSPDALFVMENDVYVDCNQKAVELLGRFKKDIINKKMIDFSPRLQPNGVLSSIQLKQHISAANAGLSQSFYWRHLKLSNDLFDGWVRLSKVDIPSEIWLLACLHTVAERK